MTPEVHMAALRVAGPAGSQAAVSDTAPIVSGIPVKMTKRLVFSARVGYFTEVTGAAPVPISHYTATISWGDGTADTTGTIEAILGGAWVVGTHTYAGSGPYTITVTVNGDGGAVVTATTTAYDPPARAQGSAAPSRPIGIPAGPLLHVRKRAHDRGHPWHAAQANAQAHRRVRVAQAIGPPHQTVARASRRGKRT
jgi:hypothetical protein